MDTTSFHPDKGPYLNDVTPGDRLIGYYTLISKNLEPFRDPAKGYFLAMTLADRSGHIQARAWEDAEQLASELADGDVLKVDGQAESYMGRTQIIVLRARHADPREYDLRDMAPSTERSREELEEALETGLNRITNPHLRALAGYFFQDPKFLDQFLSAPAARRVHHAYLGGLAEHTVEVLRVCDTVLEIYPQLDPDLMLAGALLYDIGKLREYTWGVTTDFSDEGRLIGHIVIADEMVSEAIRQLPDFPAELALRLRHMLLAHHGRQEWGSPREPRTLEAIALHHIENMVAQINRFHLILRSRQSGEPWTRYDRLLGRQLYAGMDEDGDE
ncbi:MAG TPA: HD domain-containing protein [Anaerolineales bacterium]|nr:HD domain-containing protein [Anaerolineales bacterium]